MSAKAGGRARAMAMAMAKARARARASEPANYHDARPKGVISCIV